MAVVRLIKVISEMYKSLQAGRAIAAMLVVLFHLGANLAKDSYFGIKTLAVPFSFGSSGVEFFFVLSGFIILTAHISDIDRPEGIYVYLRKRLLRIFPTYWLIFFPVLAIALAVPSMRDGVPHDFLTILKSALLIPQDKIEGGGTGAPVIIVAWTLQYEMLFYIFFAVMVMNVRLAIFVGAVSIFIYIFGIIFGTNGLPFPFSFLAQDYIVLFGMGMIVAWIVSAMPALARPIPQWIIAMGTLIFICLALDIVLEINAFDFHKILLFGFSASLIVYGLVSAEKIGDIYFGHKYVQMLGDASYALYLIHFPLISLLCKIVIALRLHDLGLTGAIFSFCIIFIICVLVSVAFHLWIERPMATYFRRRA